MFLSCVPKFESTYFMKRIFAFILLTVLFSQIQAQPKSGETITTQKQKFVFETITSGLQSVWGITFLPDGRILVTEKSGEIRVIKDGKLLPEKITGVPKCMITGRRFNGYSASSELRTKRLDIFNLLETRWQQRRYRYCTG
jgi:glucose/arabinose dehydrogenase